MSDTTLTYLDIKDSLLGINIEAAKKDLIFLMISQNEIDSINNIMSLVCECESDFEILTEINKRLYGTNSIDQIMEESSSFVDSVNLLHCLTNDPALKEVLNILLTYHGNMTSSPDILDFYGTRSSQINNVLNNPETKNIIKVFPIPSNGEINFISEELISDLKIAVYDIKGNLVLTTNFKETAQSKIDISNLSNGEYVIEFEPCQKIGV
jgi:hypothetical protein